MRSRLPLALLGLLLSAGCPTTEPEPAAGVTVGLYAARCADRNERPDEVWLEAGEPFVIAWEGEPGCYLDGADPLHYSISVSWFADAADDFWRMAWIAGGIDAVEYGEGAVAGYDSELNPDFPLAREQVEPRLLGPGDYRLTVTGWGPEFLQGTTGQVILRVVGEELEPPIEQPD